MQTLARRRGFCGIFKVYVVLSLREESPLAEREATLLTGDGALFLLTCCPFPARREHADGCLGRRHGGNTFAGSGPRGFAPAAGSRRTQAAVGEGTRASRSAACSGVDEVATPSKNRRS